MTEDSTIRRDQDHVLREYGEQKWPEMERRIAAVRAAEPDAGLSRVLHTVARSLWTREDPLATGDFVAAGEHAQLPLSGAYGAGQGILYDLVLGACEADTDLVIELGSGFGQHILTLWTSGGPRAARYVAAEFTEAGRRAAATMAELDDRLDFQAVAFDYHAPSFDGLGEREHAVVFTSHSIEQIPHVVPELVTAIRGLARRVTCIHVEPVGWQVEGHDGRGTSRAYADRHDYNRNLVQVLREREQDGDIVIDVVAPDVFGINPSNASTVVRWRSA